MFFLIVLLEDRPSNKEFKSAIRDKKITRYIDELEKLGNGVLQDHPCGSYEKENLLESIGSPDCITYLPVRLQNKKSPSRTTRDSFLVEDFANSNVYLELILHSRGVLELEVRVRLQFFLTAVVQVFMQFEIHFDGHVYPCLCQGLPQEALGL